MKIHLATVRPNRFGGYTTHTLCGRDSRESKDGFNSTGETKDVTCKFCLKLIAAGDNWAVCPRCEGDRVLDKKQHNFREDYDQGVLEDGTYYVSYHGKCTDCGLEHQFKHEQKLTF